MTATSVPMTTDGFDEHLIQRLIRTKYPEITVDEIRIIDSALSSEGEERVSTAGRVAVEVDYGTTGSVDLPRQLLVKVARAGLGDIPLYDNEVNVYMRLGDELPVKTPRRLGAYRDVPSSTFGLVLEDLRPRGARFPNSLTPTTPADIEKLLDQFAGLHAAYWESPRFGTDLSWVLPHTRGPIHDLFKDREAGLPLVVELEVETYQFKRELIQSVGETPDSLLAKVSRAQAHQATLPPTLVHGDGLIGNTYLLPDGTRGLLDWQLAARGHCINDVSYTIITGLSVQDRRSYERDLLVYYQDRLRLAGVVDVPSTEELFAEYRIACAWNFYVGWLCSPTANYGMDITLGNHIRLATAYRDLNSKAAIESLAA